MIWDLGSVTELMNQLINDNAVCRKAPTTPGLLNRLGRLVGNRPFNVQNPERVALLVLHHYSHCTVGWFANTENCLGKLAYLRGLAKLP